MKVYEHGKEDFLFGKDINQKEAVERVNEEVSKLKSERGIVYMDEIIDILCKEFGT